jgi:uncharacterized damage-inducible protein DinB
MSNEVETFLNTWENESKATIAMLKALPEGQYDFRPDAGGRSLGELAWHLSEAEAYMTLGVERGKLELGVRPPGIERPRTIPELATGYERVHNSAVQFVRTLTTADLNRKVAFFTGDQPTIREILWVYLLHHMIHHRGQLSVLCRLAGGCSPAPYGLNREQAAAMREKMAATAQ